MEKAKLLTIFGLMGIMVLLMVGYWFIARGNAELTGGFLVLTTYIIKKMMDEIDQIIDKLWGIEEKPTKTEEAK